MRTVDLLVLWTALQPPPYLDHRARCFSARGKLARTDGGTASYVEILACGDPLNLVESLKRRQVWRHSGKPLRKYAIGTAGKLELYFCPS